MKVLVVTQYFWPENFRVNDLCMGLIERGNQVDVLTAKPNYPKGKFYDGYSVFTKSFEKWNEIRIFRSNLIPRGNSSGFRLVLNYLSFALLASIRILFIKEKYDKILVYQLSPAFSAIPAFIAKKKNKTPILYYIQDLWPESIIDAGGINNTYILSAFRKLMKYFYKNSDFILIQSKGFEGFLKNYEIPIKKIFYTPNTVESFYFPKSVKATYNNQLPQGFKIMFAGNIGESQNFDVIISAAKLLVERRVEVNWVIIGEGRQKKDVQEKIEKLGMRSLFCFMGQKESMEIPDYFACADVLILALKKSYIFSLTIPSKLQSYLACGKPIIGSLDGVGADVIKDSNAGFCSKTDDYMSLADNIERMRLLNNSERKELGDNARTYFLKEFERERIYDSIQDLLEYSVN